MMYDLIQWLRKFFCWHNYYYVFDYHVTLRDYYGDRADGWYESVFRCAKCGKIKIYKNICPFDLYKRKDPRWYDRDD